jgi:hypothetical protein
MMRRMQNETDISLKIEELKERIVLLRKKKEEELKKPTDKRDRRLLIFLHKESSIYEFAVSQLEWVLAI